MQFLNSSRFLARRAAGNSPGHAVSIFFSDGKGGVFYKSVPLPGVPTDITVSPDRKWLAVRRPPAVEDFPTARAQVYSDYRQALVRRADAANLHLLRGQARILVARGLPK